MGKGFSLTQIKGFTPEQSIDYFKGLPGFEHLAQQIRERELGFELEDKPTTEDLAGKVTEESIRKTLMGEYAPTFALSEVQEGLKLEPDPIEVDVEVPDYKGPISPLQAMSAEAEIVTTGVGVGREQIDKYTYGLGTKVLDTIIPGAALTGLLPKPSEESKKILTDLISGKGELSVEESVRTLAEINEARAFHEQLISGIFVPTNIIGMPILGGKTAVTVTKAARNAQIFKDIVEHIPAVLSNNPKAAIGLKSAKTEILQGVMNKPLQIPGLEQTPIFEKDLLFWINMPADEAVDIPRYSRNIAKEGGTSGALHVTDLNSSIQRLVDVGLINRVEGTGQITKAIQSGSSEAVGILRNYGKTIGVEGASDANSFVSGLRSIESIVNEIVTIENPIIRQFAKKFGVNPSVAATTDVEKAVIAYARQNSSVSELVEIALQGGLDAQTSRWMGRTPFKIDRDGILDGTGTHWMDVFSDPKAFADNLSDATKAYIDDYIRIADEMEKLRVASGLDPLSKDRNGLFYVPRQVLGVDDIEFLRQSDSHFGRKWDTATEAMLGRIDPTIKPGVGRVVYETDPRENLRVHLQAAYHEILDGQLSDYIASKGRSFAPTEILEKLNPKVFARHEAATKAVLNAKNRLKQLTNELPAVPITRETGAGTGISRRIAVIQEGAAARKAVQKQIEEARAAFKAAQAELKASKAQRTRALEKIRRSEIVSGTLWGEVSDEAIPVKMWRNRIFKLDDFEALEAGIGHIAGDTKGFTKALGRAVDTSRWLQSNGDFGSPFIQGLPLMWRNPGMWTKATLKHFEAWVSPTTQARFIRQNLGTFQEMAQYGVPVGDVEFFRAMQKGRGISPGALLTMLPEEEGGKIFGDMVAGKNVAVAGRAGASLRRGARSVQDQSLGRFQTSYNMFLAMSRAMMWKGMKESWTQPGKQGNTLGELGAYIRNMTGALDSKALGVSAGQREIEGIWLAFSPRLLRSTIALVADAGRYIPAEAGRLTGGPGATVRQKESARAISSLLMGVHGTYVTAQISSGMAKGHDSKRIWQDIQEGMNPLSGGKYLSIEVDGQMYGVGGQVRALTQLLYGVTSSLAPGGDPLSNIWQLNSRDNPLLRFLAFRGAVGQEWAGAVIEGTTDIDALPFDSVDRPMDIPAHVFESSLPFVAQGVLEGDSAPGVAIGNLGLRSQPLSPAQEETKLVEDAFYQMSPEELAEYDHEAGNWPGRHWKRDLSSELREDISEASPEIQAAIQRKLDVDLELGRDYGTYKQAKIDLRSVRDNAINSNAETYKDKTKTLRENISAHYRDYADDAKDLNESDQYKEMLGEFDELEPSSHPFDMAKEEYWRVMTQDPPLEDPVTLEYDFKEHDERIESLQNNPLTAKYFDRIRADIEEEAPPIVQELRRDRDTLRPFWDIADEVATQFKFNDRYEFYRDQNQHNRADMKDGPVPELDWTAKDAARLSLVEKKIDADREDMRMEDPVIDALLWKWDYRTNAINFDVKRIWLTKLKLEQGGVFTDKLAIEKFIETYQYAPKIPVGAR